LHAVVSCAASPAALASGAYHAACLSTAAAMRKAFVTELVGVVLLELAAVLLLELAGVVLARSYFIVGALYLMS
jgi:hypothetical protein